MPKPTRFTDEQADAIAAAAIVLILAATAVIWIAGL